MASRSDLLRLLDDVEDYLVDGYRRKHLEPAPSLEPGSAIDVDLDAPQARRGASPAASPLAGAVLKASAPTGRSQDGVSGGTAQAQEQERETRLRLLAELAAEVGACTRCGLCRGRAHAVPGEGAIDPLVMVVGEGPGADEDASGRPFVGRAGQYLDKWLEAVKLSRESSAYIANIVKCRPPGNRDPLPDEMTACRPFLDRQIELVRPRVILTVGRISSGNLTGLEVGINRLRGKTYSYRDIPLIPTYHPSGVLRNPDFRAPVWEDLRRLRKHLDEPLP